MPKWTPMNWTSSETEWVRVGAMVSPADDNDYIFDLMTMDEIKEVMRVSMARHEKGESLKGLPMMQMSLSLLVHLESTTETEGDYPNLKSYDDKNLQMLLQLRASQDWMTDIVGMSRLQNIWYLILGINRNGLSKFPSAEVYRQVYEDMRETPVSLKVVRMLKKVTRVDEPDESGGGFDELAELFK